MLPAVLATASLAALGACDYADATVSETEAVPTEFQLSAEDLQLSAQELALLCGDTTDVGPELGIPGEIDGDLQQWNPDYPNEPAGFATVLDQLWNALPSDPTNAWRWNESGKLSLVTDDLFPDSQDKVVRVRVTKGMDGVGSHNAWFPFPSGHRDYSEIYFAASYKFPADWVNHSTASKQLWPRFHNHNNSPFTAFWNSSMRIAVALQGEPWGPRNLFPNTGPSQFHNLENWRDQWVQLEYYIKMNTVNHRNGDTSKADGIVRVWMSAGGETQLILDYDDVKFLNTDERGNYVGQDGSPSSGKFTSIQWNPTYGGKGSPAPRDLDYYLRSIYVSGRSGR